MTASARTEEDAVGPARPLQQPQEDAPRQWPAGIDRRAIAMETGVQHGRTVEVISKHPM